MLASFEAEIPPAIRSVLRGVGQVFFQENALTGACFLIGIALSSPLMALGALLGSAIGCAAAWGLKFDRSELMGGIYGFNSALVGIATFFFFQPSVVSVVSMVVGCFAAALVTRAMRRFLPFPTYTTPFIVTTWVVYFVGKAVGATGVVPEVALLVPNIAAPFAVESTLHGVGQVMFQASLWTGTLFLVGIALSEWRHAAWVLAGSIAGMLVGSYHVTAGSDAIDPERLIARTQFDTIQLGLYGYNATLAAVALFLWRRSLIAPLLGVLFSVPLTELVPRLGLPALTAPFVLATWIVLGLGCLERRIVGASSPVVEPPAGRTAEVDRGRKGKRFRSR